MTGGFRFRALAYCTALVLLILFGVGLQRAFAEPVVNIQKQYYPAAGLTENQIRLSLDRNTPVRIDGQPFDAYTRWDIDWQLQWAFDGDGTCRMTAVNTVVRVLQTLPQLDHRGDLPPRLANRWEHYMIALVEHEAGHMALGIDAARDMEAQLLQMGDRSSCDQLEADADSLARDIIARYAILESRYDADTNYGAYDGARFP